jgi:ABC-type lipoprotein export system ATPase subunit
MENLQIQNQTQEKPGKAAIIRITRLIKIYPGQSEPVTALKGIDLKIEEGEFVAIIGRSGSGKTTLVNMLTGLDRMTSGEVWVGGTAIHHFNEEQAAGWRGSNAGVVFQSFHLLPSLSALQNVTLPMDFARRGTLRERNKHGMEILAQLGLEEHAYKRPAQVSGGQQQRIAIARALANDPPLIVADEPTGSLDSATADDVFNIFRDLSRQGKTILMVTHDAEMAQRADRMLVLTDGEIASK